MSGFDASQLVKSEWLKGSELPGPTRVTVQQVSQYTFEGDDRPKAVLHFLELDQKLAMNKTQTRSMIELRGSNTGAWTGAELVLTPAPSFNGKQTINISRAVQQQDATPQDVVFS